MLKNSRINHLGLEVLTIIKLSDRNAFRINTERLSKMSYLLKNEKKQNMLVEFIKGFNILRTY